MSFFFGFGFSTIINNFMQLGAKDDFAAAVEHEWNGEWEWVSKRERGGGKHEDEEDKLKTEQKLKKWLNCADSEIS